MAVNWPLSPSDGQIHTQEGRSWQFFAAPAPGGWAVVSVIAGGGDSAWLPTQIATGFKSVEFTGIDPNCHEIAVYFDKVGPTGSDDAGMIFGNDTDGYVTTYESTALYMAGSGLGNTRTDYVQVIIRSAARTVTGKMVFTRVGTSPLWIGVGNFGVNPSNYTFGSAKFTAGANGITKLEVEMKGGSLFAAGNISVFYRF